MSDEIIDIDADSLHESLVGMTEQINELIEYAHGEGYRAVAHKLEEAWGRLNSAATAARQYATGELEPR